jgi:hypothetical protein
MKSLRNSISVLAMAMILTACGSEESATSTTGNNLVDDTTPPDTSVNRSPVISGVPVTLASVDTSYSFTPNASDPDGDSLTFSLANPDSLPSWAELDSDSGTLSGTPTLNDVGSSAPITLTVSDGSETASLAAFTITVVDSGEIEVVTARVSSGSDDAEEWDTGTMNLSSSDLEMAYDDGTQLVGLRFSLPIPSGAVITQANLRFTVDEVTTDPAELTIWAEAADDASAFTENSGDISSRSSTVTVADWTPQPWSNVGDSASAQTSTNFSNVIQEIVSRPGWSSDNHVVLVISGSGVRTADAYEGNAASAALLTVHYSGGDNRAPTITGVPDTGATESYAYSFTPIASDPDGDTLEYAIDGKPDWANFDIDTGTLSGTPQAGDAGTYSGITISVSDGSLSAALPSFEILVSDVNRAPSISGSPVTSATEQTPYSFTPRATDADGDTLSFSISGRPSWAVFDEDTGNLSGTPGYADAGTYSDILISVSDGSVSASLDPFTINVADLNRAPVISGTAATTVAEGDNYSFTPVASDPDGNTVSFSINNRPTWASFDEDTGRLYGAPGYDDAGSYTNIVISASDGVDSVSLSAFAITVSDVNQAPTISGSPSTQVTAGGSYSFTPTADDVDGDALTFSINVDLSWATFDETTGRLTGTPEETDVGTYGDIQITVSDGNEVVSLAPFSITVNSSASTTGSIVLSWTAPSTRSDGTALDVSELGGYQIFVGDSESNLEMEMDLNVGSATGTTISDKPLGTYFVAITAYDQEGNISSYSNVIEVSVTN